MASASAVAPIAILPTSPALGRRRDGLERLAWAGALRPARIGERAAAAGRPRTVRCGARARGGMPAGERQLAAASRPPRPPLARAGAPRRCPSSSRGSGSRRLPLDRDDARRAPDDAAARRLGESVVRSRELGHRRRGPSRLRAWWSRASGPRPPRESSSCCSRTRRGVINLVVPPPVAKRYRLAVRTRRSCALAGKLERREGSSTSSSHDRAAVAPGRPRREVRSIEPPPERETGRAQGSSTSPSAAPAEPPELAAVAAAGPQLRRGADEPLAAALAFCALAVELLAGRMI